MKKFKKWDIWLIAAIVLIALASWIYLRFSRDEGAFVVASVDGEVTGRYPLSQPLSLELESPGGSHFLVIEDGTAKVTAADCPDKLCVNQKAIRFQGESIICLPHRLEIRIEGGEEGGVDALAQ